MMSVPTLKKIEQKDSIEGKPTRYSFPLFVLYVRSHGHSTNPQLLYAIVASKKNVSKKATLRNRSKRRLRAAFGLVSQQVLGSFPNDKKVSIIIVAKSQVLTCAFDGIVNSLKEGIEKSLCLL